MVNCEAFLLTSQISEVVESFLFHLVLILIGLFGLCGAQGGASWTAEETEIIYKKLRTLFKADMKNSLRQQ